ncbi:hypothetical protein LY28_01683 [Ruminiclostridium sufflavum DSM 19573]|uniref:Uncharacterized protein n=1 Tax=Ruminiclostridium sufflavum DSM 19573 TaxID=1121337 RepID=A0A318XMX2_9FIRM|nr:hypothetical protein [Ruminiclostridium sufflavum]PYG87973.1 hypothetical protein LY28_01683 [Ruminiclostridium sufflavum DSM 19573]
MEEKITALYTNLYDANNAISSLKTNGIATANLNSSDYGLHKGFKHKSIPRKFPGAVASTVVKLEISVNPANRDSAVSVVAESYGVID